MNDARETERVAHRAQRGGLFFAIAFALIALGMLALFLRGESTRQEQTHFAALNPCTEHIHSDACRRRTCIRLADVGITAPLCRKGVVPQKPSTTAPQQPGPGSDRGDGNGSPRNVGQPQPQPKDAPPTLGTPPPANPPSPPPVPSTPKPSPPAPIRETVEGVTDTACQVTQPVTGICLK